MASGVGPAASAERAALRFGATWPLARALAWVVLALMAVATLYTGWIAVANVHRIGV